jgi:hypothetical protein
MYHLTSVKFCVYIFVVRWVRSVNINPSRRELLSLSLNRERGTTTDEQMRILYITNICDIGTILVEEATRKNIEAHYIDYPWAKRKPTNFLKFLLFVLKNNLVEFDVYHYNWPIASLLPENKDINMLRNQGKKVFLHYHGDDIRNKKEKESLKNVDGKIISTPDLKQFLPDATWVPFPLDIRGMKKRKGWNDTPKIVHAPSDRSRKGTTHILRAIKELKRKYTIQFELIEKKPNTYVLERMAASDIVIDQIGPGWYGKITLEALYSGAVSCFRMNPELSQYIPFDFFVPITKETIVKKVAGLIEDTKLRNTLRAKGYEYLKK